MSEKRKQHEKHISGVSDLDIDPEKEYNIEWVPDEDVDNCHVCDSKFDFFRRKHHCRACGNVCCNKCIPSKEKVIGLIGKHKICSTCKLNVDNQEKEVVPVAVTELNISTGKIAETESRLPEICDIKEVTKDILEELEKSEAATEASSASPLRSRNFSMSSNGSNRNSNSQFGIGKKLLCLTISVVAISAAAFVIINKKGGNVAQASMK